MIENLTSKGLTNTSSANENHGKTMREKVDDAVKIADPNGTASWLPDTTLRVINGLSAAEAETMSIDQLILYVMLKRGSTIEDSVRKQAAKIELSSKRLAALGEIKAELAKYGTDNSNPNKVVDGFDKDVINQIATRKDINISISWAEFCNADGAMTNGGLASLVGKMDTMSQSISNLQTMEMTKLQDSSQKMNQAYELGSNFIKKVGDTKSGVAANIR